MITYYYTYSHYIYIYIFLTVVDIKEWDNFQFMSSSSFHIIPLFSPLNLPREMFQFDEGAGHHRRSWSPECQGPDPLDVKRHRHTRNGWWLKVDEFKS